MRISPATALVAWAAVVNAATCIKQDVGGNETIVDLGYAVHRGSLNETYDYYSFKNIRYSEPPVGELRWRPSVPPQTINRTVNDGSPERRCPQAYPHWILQPQAAAAGIPVEMLVNILIADERMHEDCLFLDVHVPADIFARRGKVASGSAVMVWIHGGGYDIGFKNQAPFDTPAGLIERSRSDNQEGVIFISINYRLGMFGFLDRTGTEMVGNAGFWDQRLALQWVQKYAHLFGGDKNRVTIIGESAGGGSVLHQITAFGGEGEAPFAAAIVQSPAIRITTNSSDVWDITTSVASQITGKQITSVQDLRQLNSSALMRINQAAVAGGDFGQFLYGPTVDGEFVPELPGVLLLKGQFHQQVKVMAGHNKNESGMFLPGMDSNEEFMTYLEDNYPMNDEARELVTTYLYPNVMDGTHTYMTQFGRANQLSDEMLFSCNTYFLGTAFQNKTYNYRFEVGPGSHGQDLAWTFFVEQNSAVSPELAISMQRYFTNFAMTGDPNGKATNGLPLFPQYGEQATLLTFGDNGIGTTEDTMANPRCDYWQRGSFKSGTWGAMMVASFHDKLDPIDPQAVEVERGNPKPLLADRLEQL